jgi:hypothetical protein
MRLLLFALHIVGAVVLGAEIAMGGSIIPKTEEIAAEYPAFGVALGLLASRDLRTVVATKTSPILKQEERVNPILAVFNKMARTDDALHFYELDNGEGAPLGPEKSREDVLANIHVIVGDTPNSLRKLPSRIDLLYLGSSGSETANETRDHRVMPLREVMSAYSHLHRGSVVMIDGCGLGKCGLAKLYLGELAWRVVYSGPQLVMIPSDATLIAA